MNASSVILIAFFTAALTSVGTTLLTQRLNGAPPVASAAPAEEPIVPDFVGVLEADARVNAAAAHVALMVAGREASAGKKPGTVIRQSVPAGQRVPREHPISVVLADELPNVPNVVGQSGTDATARLEQAGYKVTSGQVPHATVPEGKVIDQAPSADSPLEKGAVVALHVSGGPAEVEVPRVVGASVSHAKSELEKRGLKPVIEWTSIAESQGLIVLRQTPDAGQKAKPGTEVRLVANQ